MNKKKMTTPTISEMMATGLFVPNEQRDRIRRLYGSMTFDDFDKEFGFNDKMGAFFPTCFQTMMYCMNVTDGAIADQFDKLNWSSDIGKTVMQDMFNLVQSAVRTLLGEQVWYK